MTRDELAARDEVFLEETRLAAEEAIDLKVILPRNPAWGHAYDPLRVMCTTDSPDVFRLALVTQRIAMHPEESWDKCVNCSRLYLCGAYGNTCSAECFAAYSNFLDNQQ